MKGIIRIVSLTTVTLAAITTLAAQDLGSANKLFGGNPKPATSTTNKRTSKKSTAPKHHAPSHSTTARKRSATSAKPESDKSVANKTPAPKSNAKPAKTTDHSAGDHATGRFTGNETGRFSGNAASRVKTEDKQPAKPVETRLSPAEEARFEELIDQANNARDDRDYVRAESAYKSARAIKPRDSRAIYGLGNVYSDQQRWEEAENAYRTALQLEPSSAVGYVALSYVLTQPLPVNDLSERYAEAEKLARRATELSPRNALAFDQLGVAMEMRGEIGSETENIYRKAIALDPTFAPAYAHLGRLMRRLGMVEQSKEAYRQAIERSTDVGTTVLVAEVMQSEQHYADSLPLLKQALEADPRNPSALLMYGHALIVTGQYKDAEAALQRALAVGSNGYQADLLLSSLYMRQGAYELAENSLLQALRWAPAYENRQLAQQFVMLGQGYSKVGKSQQSQRAYSQAAKLDPDSGMLSGRFRQ